MRDARFCLRLKRSAWCTLAFGLIASLALSFGMFRQEQRSVHDNFERRAQFRVAAVKQGMDNAIEALQVVNRLFATNGSVSREQFHFFTQPLHARHPYIERFDFQWLVSGAERPAFEARMRASYPAFAIGDMMDGKRVVAAVKSHYRVIDYVEPTDPAFGLDTTSQTLQDAAVRRTEDTGLPSATGLFQRFGEHGSQRSFRILMAVYKGNVALADVAARRRAVLGYTGIVLRAADLIEKFLASAGSTGNAGLDIRVYAADSADESKLVYGQAQRDSVPPAWLFGSQQEHVSHNFDVAGTVWQILVSAQSNSFAATHASALLTLLIGVLTTLAATIYLQSVTLGAQRIQQLVAQRTSELKHVNQLLLDDIKVRQQVEQALLASRSDLRSLAGHQEGVREDERKRIARDIHDELGQNLMVLRIDLSMMAAHADAVAITREKVESAVQQLDRSIKAVRAIINDLRPAVLDFGLHAAIEWQAGEFERRTGIACELHIDHEEFALDDKRATALFRIVQESLSNIMRHAKASHVQIGMQRRDGMLLVNIADDGIGLAPDSGNKPRGFGLVGIEERILALGGTFSIANNPGAGMALTLSIPIERDIAALADA